MLRRILKLAIVLGDAVFIALVAHCVVSVIRYLLFSLLLWRRLLAVELLDANSGLASGCRRGQGAGVAGQGEGACLESESRALILSLSSFTQVQDLAIVFGFIHLNHAARLGSAPWIGVD